jgi:hypothetical protein
MVAGSSSVNIVFLEKAEAAPASLEAIALKL